MSEPTRLSLRIARVTVYEDRADVVRESEVTLGAGSTVLLAEGLPALVSDALVVAHLEPIEAAAGASVNVNDTRVTRVTVTEPDPLAERRRARRDELHALERAVHSAEEGYKRHSQRRATAEITLKRWLEQLQSAVGRGQGGAGGAWTASVNALETELFDADAARAHARRTLDDAKRALTAAHDDVREKPRPSRVVADLTIRVSGDAGRYKVIVKTVVPCAAWRPSHEAVLTERPDGKKLVRFTTFASVWQRTGEAWDDIDVVLSTARPSAGAELPPLASDRLSLRLKTPEEKRTIVVEHRSEEIPQTAQQGSAPGVDDGGEPRVFRAPKMSVRDDGRPHRAQVARFEAPCSTERIALPELATQVFLRASLKNAGQGPILAGSVTLIVEHAQGGSTFVGTGDVTFCGQGEPLDLSFGSDDRFLVRTRTKRVDDKKLVGKDVVHFVREAVLTQTGHGPERVTVQLRLPVSEVKQLKVIPSAHLCTDGEPRPDEHGVVKIPIELAPGVERKVALAFSFDRSGDVRVSDPW